MCVNTIPDINQSPTFINAPTTVPVSENVAVGTSVHTVSYVDNDVGQTHTFTLEPSAFFEIDPSSKCFYTRLSWITGTINTFV